MKKWLILIGMALLLPVALTPAPALAAEKVPIPMGIIGDLSGPTSGLAGIAYGARDYYSYYNWKHGGINGHPISYLLLDGAEDIPKETANYKHLITMLKPVTLHVWSTGANKALRTAINKVDRIPTFGETMSLEIIDPKNLPYHFISGGGYEDEIMIFMDWAKRLGGKTMVVLSGNLDWNMSSMNRVLKDPFNYAPKIGLKVLEYITFPARPTDVTSEMLRAKALNPDFYLVWDVLEGVIPSLRAAEELGVPREKFFVCHWSMHPLVIERCSAEGVKSFKIFPDADELSAKGLPVGKEIDEFDAKHKIYTRRWEYVKGWCESKIQVEGVKRVLDKNNNIVPKDILVFRKMVRDEIEGLKDWDLGIGHPTPVDFSDHKGWTWMTPMIVKGGKWVEHGPMMSVIK